jgi:hypothetical protein
MFKLSVLCACTVFLISCGSNERKKSADTKSDTAQKVITGDTTLTDLGYFRIEGDSLVIPSFDVEIVLSAKANAKLKSKKETIIIAAYFSGQPKDTTTKEYMQSGEMGLVQSVKELKGDERTATIEGAKFPKALYDSLADKDIQMLINVYSGRRSTNVNLLDCDILQDKMSVLKGKKFTLKGKLIGEK